MSVKKIIKYGDKALREKSKEVHKISKKIQSLVDDLLDTMYAYNGVGLAAPQLGVLSRVFVIDTSSGNEPLNPIVFINPKIIKKSGAINSYEGCLSFPEAYTDVRRYGDITIKALDRKGRPFVIEAKEKDNKLLARAIQHEFDHLDGILFIDHARNRFEADKALLEKGLAPIEPERLIEEDELEQIILKTPSKDETKSTTTKEAAE